MIDSKAKVYENMTSKFFAYTYTEMVITQDVLQSVHHRRDSNGAAASANGLGYDVVMELSEAYPLLR